MSNKHCQTCNGLGTIYKESKFGYWSNAEPCPTCNPQCKVDLASMAIELDRKKRERAERIERENKRLRAENRELKRRLKLT